MGGLFNNNEKSNDLPVIKDDDPYAMGRTKSRSFTSAMGRPAFGKNFKKVESFENLLNDKDDNTS